MDGNKRTGFMTGYVFLARNQIQFVVTEPEATQWVLALAADTINAAAFAEWLGHNVRQI